MSTLLREFSDGLAAIGGEVLQSLVQVRSGEQGAGAGIIWLSAGLILTNAHVVSRRRQPARRGPQRTRHSESGITVVLADGRTLPASVVAEAQNADLALLQIDADDLPAVRRGDSRRLRPGELVVALGFPWGVTGGATSGVVIAPVGQLAEQPVGDHEWLAASLHLRPGHSGGPMVDSAGRLVGINTLMAGPNVGVAVPVHVAEAFVSDAMAV